MSIPWPFIQQTLIKHDFSKQIVSHYYNCTEEGFMDMERIHERGLVNATDANIMRNQSTARENMALMDYGNRLIEKSYIIVIDFGEIRRISQNNREGYAADVTASLFNFDFSKRHMQMI